MPLTAEQLDNHFSYHAPTEETAPKYAAIRKAEEDCHVTIGHLFSKGPNGPQVWDPEQVAVVLLGGNKALGYAEVNRATRTLVEVIDQNAPDSADKSAAIRCVRLARNALNEAIATNNYPESLRTCAHENLRMARWQANSAVACGGK
jgi:hypothetical protein